MQNSDIFANNIFIPNDINQNNSQNNSNKDNQLFQINEDRYKMRLTLRKKKLEENLAKSRKIDFFNNINNNSNNVKINTEKFIILNESFTNLISQIAIDYQDEIKLKILLEKIKIILNERCKNKNAELIGKRYQFTVDDLYKNNWIEKFYELILIYLKNSEIMEIIIVCLYLSSEFIKYFSENDNLLIDNNSQLNKNGYFISSDKYIDLYNKILDMYIKEKNDRIIYFMLFFISNIVEEDKGNQESLFISGTLNYIINSIDIENDTSLEIDAKIWCIGKFDLEEKYNINLDLTLKIQNIYVELFLNQEKFNLFDGINKEMDENNIFYNFLKLIDNTSYCTQVAYIETLLKSNILEFLMDNINSENKEIINIILDTYINLTTAETSLLNRLIDIGVLKFLVTIVKDKTLNNDIHNKALVSINNLLMEPQLWNKVLFDNQVLKLFCILLQDKNIDKDNFSEICIGLRGILFYLKEDDLKKIVDEYFIIQLTTIAMKNILEANKKLNPSHCLFYLTLIIKYMSVDYDDIKGNIFFKFQSVGGLELIDQIINRYVDIDKTNVSNDVKKDINIILAYTQRIKETIIGV
jgi:hypothetical protein